MYWPHDVNVKGVPVPGTQVITFYDTATITTGKILDYLDWELAWVVFNDPIKCLVWRETGRESVVTINQVLRDIRWQMQPIGQLEPFQEYLKVQIAEALKYYKYNRKGECVHRDYPFRVARHTQLFTWGKLHYTTLERDA